MKLMQKYLKEPLVSWETKSPYREGIYQDIGQVPGFDHSSQI
jgi:hypothetical protein